MTYRITETLESVDDVANLAKYMLTKFKNPKAAVNFLDQYDKKIKELQTFPFGYRGISFEYRGYEIRLKPFDTYNVFFVVDTANQEIIILRVLKDRQDWQAILKNFDQYHI